jgi:Rdx family
VLNDHGHEASAREGDHSQYDVFADGELVFSKQQERRFPEEAEILQRLAGPST